MDDSDAFRLEHNRKVIFFECYWRFLPFNHPLRSEKWSFLKDKTVSKGPPKRKHGPDIMKMLDDLKESENCELEGYGEKHNWTHKSCLWKLSYTKTLIPPNNIDFMH
jgi:hypothetical protein